MSESKFLCTASLLEQYRLWRDDGLMLTEAQERMDDVDLWVSRLDSAETQSMAAGTAFHKIVELAKIGEAMNVIECDGLVFDFSALDAEIVAPIIKEHRYYRKAGKTVVSGQVDAITADGFIIDYKTTAAVDADKYVSSAQWKIYLWLTGLNSFRFDVFKIMPPTDKAPNVYRVVDHVPIECHRYDGMDAYVEQLVHDFSEAMSINTAMREAVERAARRRAKENA